MEGLWIKSCGKGLDFVRLEGVAADWNALAQRDVLEIFHVRATSSRRAIISGLVSVVSTHVVLVKHFKQAFHEAEIRTAFGGARF